jgi:hypothetical protein
LCSRWCWCRGWFSWRCRCSSVSSERAREKRQAEESAKRIADDQAVEVSKRLKTVREELKANRKSIQEADAPLRLGSKAVNPQLLDGAWTASAPSLAELLADYELTAEIARVYGRIEELRWRLRTRTETRVNTLDDLTIALVVELGPEVDALLQRITAEIPSPTVPRRVRYWLRPLS